ncbi:M3 family metallopeptidase [Novosphingobium mathurense]|uniref:Dipeptidyl carboxypeptidase n=1 Tax=Novosphingobium mathurense TaxID=428990 RepID=A0A1U6GRQ9_9SPHN|nr:M3 family metallopeptidase [Novosphingobium mathurense]SLJ86223.1 peptidyl-dipeptidase Dcp Metallo peptidase. MEROPS family M03A [Novosphingobium mathurense]
MKIRLMTATAPLVLGAMLMSGCTTVSAATDAPKAAAGDAATTYAGPFAKPSTLPFHAPDFASIGDSDYQPAIEAGIAAKRAEIAAIADNPAAPDFDNTIVALEKAGSLLTRVRNVFDQLVSANTNDTLDAVDTAMSPKLAALDDDMYLNEKLFARVKSVHDSAQGKALTGEDAMLLATTYADFVHEGALLAPAQKAQLKQMNLRLASLETEFSQKLTAGTAAADPVFDSAAQLDGMPEAAIAAAAKHAEDKGLKGKYAIALLNFTQHPALSQLKNRASRKTLFEASVNRTSSGGEYDTTGIVSELATLRAKKAALLGKPDFASWQMYDRMVTSPAKAMSFMQSFVPALSAAQTREAKELQDFAKAHGDDIALQPWDWGYYAEQVRRAKYDLDDAQIKPYFEVWRVLEDGVFHAATKTYGITFKRRTDLPVYHPTMRTYEVYDKDGSELALFYFDPFARPNKQGGAWMGNFVEQSYLTGDKPVIFNTLNIVPPAEGQPALATWDNVTTMFHEFGHALHGMFASQKYPSLAGSNTARDFVEFPSQFNENFATVPEVLNHYAKHYRTGAAIPPELIGKIEAASRFNQGLGLGETLEAAMLDMDWHRLTPEQAGQPPMAFEGKALAEMGLRTDLIPPRYRTPYFRHIWSNGYSAGYYAYIWTEMLAHDGWDWVEKHGGMTRANGDHIRASFLGQGHSKDYAVMYRDFTGYDPEVEPMLEARGLVSKGR